MNIVYKIQGQDCINIAYVGIKSNIHYIRKIKKSMN